MIRPPPRSPLFPHPPLSRPPPPGRGGGTPPPPRLDRREAVHEPHAAVAVAVPVDCHPLVLDDFTLDESHEGFHAVRRRVPDGVRETDPRRPAVDRDRKSVV